MTSRTRMSPQRRRTQLITVGWSMLRDRALDQISIGDVARALGISRGLVFHYFSSKQDFQNAIAEEHCRRLLAAAEPDLSIDDRMALLRHSIEGFLDFVVANRGAFLGLLRGHLSTLPMIVELDEQVRNQLVAWVIDAARTLEAVDLEAATVRLQMLIRGWLSFSEEVTVVWVRGMVEVDGTPTGVSENGMTRDDIVDMIAEGFFALAELSGFKLEQLR